MSFAVSDAITYARQKGQTDSNGISNTNGLAWANNGLIDITRDLIRRGVDAAQIQEAYMTSSASDAQPGRFTWPNDMFALKSVEIDYTGTGTQNYLQGSQLDVANLQGDLTWDYLRINQPTNLPRFTNHGDTGEIFPTPIAGQPALIRIFYYLAPTEYATVSDVLTYPQSLDWRALGDKILIAYFESLKDQAGIQLWESRYQQKLNDAIHILGPQSKMPVKPEKLQLDGWNL